MIHRSGVAFHSRRVSTLRPPKANSFQNRVPTGNSQAWVERASIVAPGGRYTQRRLVAPSVQSGYCGANGRLRASTTPGRPCAKSPVSERRSGGRGSSAARSGSARRDVA